MKKVSSYENPQYPWNYSLNNQFSLCYNLFQRSIAQDATELKEKATNVEDALLDVNGFLQRLQDLAEEVSIKN